MEISFASPAFAFTAFVIFVAIFVRTLTGFGAALIMVPMLSLAWDLRQAVVLAALVQAATGFLVAIQSRKDASWSALAVLLTSSLCGLAFGTFLLTILPLVWLRRILGALTLLFGISRFTPIASHVVPVPTTRQQLLGVPVGFIGGLLTGSIGTGGPPIVAYLHYRLSTAATRRATLLIYFMVLDLIRVPGYLRLGIGSTSLLWTGAALIPFALLGIVGGNYALGRLSDRFLSQAIALLLILTGLLLLR